MIEKPKNNAKLWTAEDIRELERLIAAKRPRREIAVALGRTRDTVNTRAGLIRRGSKPVSLKPDQSCPEYSSSTS